MRTAAATAAAAGARSPPLPARLLARSPLPCPPRPRPAQVPEESGALPEDAAAAVPCAARAPPRPESPAGASAEAPGAPSLPTFSGGSPPPLRGEGVSYRLKITTREHWVSPSLPATGPGEGLGQPPRTSPRRACCGRAGLAAPGRRVPTVTHTSPGARRGRSGAGGRSGSGLAAPAVLPGRGSGGKRCGLGPGAPECSLTRSFCTKKEKRPL